MWKDFRQEEMFICLFLGSRRRILLIISLRIVYFRFCSWRETTLAGLHTAARLASLTSSLWRYETVFCFRLFYKLLLPLFVAVCKWFALSSTLHHGYRTGLLCYPELVVPHKVCFLEITSTGSFVQRWRSELFKFFKYASIATCFSVNELIKNLLLSLFWQCWSKL